MDRLQTDNKDVTVSFNLNELFGENDLQISEIDSQDFPDNILSEIILDPTIINAQKMNESECPLPQSKQVRSRSWLNENRFKAVDIKEIDDIAGKIYKKTTHKQTDWGVKVFRDQRKY